MTGTGGGAAPPLTLRPRRQRTLVSAALETGAVLGTALRLVWRHWPVLFALFFAGAAAREFITIGAVQASKIHGVVGMLVVVLGPIASLTALVLMLRALRSSLPWLAAATDGAPAAESGPEGGPPPRRRTLMDHLASALVPFLAVYASWGYLQDDVSNYIYLVWEDSFLNNADIFTDPAAVSERAQERQPFDITVVLIAAVVAAVGLRWLLLAWQKRQGPRRWAVLGVIAAYFEVIWILVTMAVLNQARDPLTTWLRERRVVQVLLDFWNDVVSALGPFTDAVRAAGEWLVGAISSADTVIVVPLAWLAVGAVVYGHRLGTPGPPASELLQRASSRWNKLPRPVRVVGTGVSTDVRDRFGPLVHSVRMMARAGLAPMLFFCLAFLAAQSARDWMWEAERLIIGPRDLQSVWMPVSGPLATLNDGVATVLLACLLGAAVDRVLRAQPPAAPAAADEAQPAVSRA